MDIQNYDKDSDELGDDVSLLGREKFFNSFKNEIINNKESLHIALCGSWGTGKTVFVKKLKKELPEDKVLCIYMNAWDYDYYETPIYAILSCLLENNKYRESFDTKVLNFSAENVSLSTNVPFLNINVKFKNQRSDLLSKIQYSTFAQRFIYESISEFIKEKTNNLVVFIDELDRCRPDFAVELLEQLKHFRFKNYVSLVYVIDDEQLSHSLKKVYGESYNTSQYLHKVFDSMITFPQITEDGISFYLRKYLSDFAEDWIYIALNEAVKSYDLSLRDINRLVKYLRRIDRSFNSNFDFPTNGSVLKIIMIFVAVTKIKDPIFLSSFMLGDVSAEKFALSLNKCKYICDILAPMKNCDPKYSNNLVYIINWLLGIESKYHENYFKKILYEELYLG